jgi:2-polyprenyl-3-methyl-5-hydroxy-6-metoxy-1,4-benzoquinol methylase
MATGGKRSMMNEHDDWDKHWDDLTHSCRYIPAQGFRRLLVIRWLQRQKPTPNDRLVDIGSGQGDLIADLTHLFPTLDLAGSEMSAIGIEQSKVKSPKAHFFQHDLTLPPAPDDPLSGWARWAVCCEVLEHVDEPEKVLAHASQFLAPGARLFITVPGGPISAFDRHIGHRKHFTTEWDFPFSTFTA